MVLQEIDLLAQIAELKAGIAETTLKSVPTKKSRTWSQKQVTV